MIAYLRLKCSIDGHKYHCSAHVHAHCDHSYNVLQVVATSALSKIITTGFRSIQLIYFFTAGEDEVKCWQIRKGSKAPQVSCQYACQLSANASCHKEHTD